MERAWATRLRWRLRGAWLAPVVVVLTLADALLIHALPFGADGTDLAGALLLALLLNLVAVAAVAPFAAIALRRLRPDLPKVVARDYAGVALVLVVAGALLAGGVAHHTTVVRDRRALADAHARAVAWIGAHAPARFRRHVALADTVAIVDRRMYRTCVPALDGGRAWCVVVRTAVPFPGGVRFDGGEPNEVFQAGR